VTNTPVYYDTFVKKIILQASDIFILKPCLRKRSVAAIATATANVTGSCYDFTCLESFGNVTVSEVDLGANVIKSP
jgi:hypothetical protein